MQLAKNITAALITIFSALSAIISTAAFVSILTLPPYGFPWIPLYCLIFGVAFIAPRSALLSLLFLLPLFGNRPGSEQALYLFFVSSAVVLGASRLIVEDFKILINSAGTVVFFAALYLFISYLSLSSLPARELLYAFLTAVPEARDIGALSNFFVEFLLSTEEQVLYPLLATAWTTLSFNLMILAYLLGRRHSANVTRFFAALLGGLIVSIAAGLLDYYSLIDLSAVRDLDPVVNPWGIQYRLQSFFGHSGWFAEYLTLCMPFVVILLQLRSSFRSRLAAIIVLLLAGELSLILSFQRGGWVSYPLTLLVVWAAVYVYRRLEIRRDLSVYAALKGSLFKIIISIPLTLIISLLIFSGLSKLKLIDADSGAVLSRYVNRFSDITKASDRTDFIKAGYLIGTIYPFFGGGSESFAYHFNREFNQEGGRFYDQLNLPLYGSSHNVYLQTFAGKGAAGLLLLLLLIGWILIKSLAVIMKSEDTPLEDKLNLLAVVSFLAAFLIYGNFQEIFYIQPLQHLFFIVIGCAAALLKRQTIGERGRLFIIISLAAAAAFHFYLLSRMPERSSASYGCHGRELDKNGRPYRWCSARSLHRVELNNAQLEVIIETAPFRAGRGSDFAFYLDGVLLHEERLTPSKLHTLRFSVPGEFIGRSADLYISSSNYLVPAVSFKRSRDQRVLAYKLYQIK